MIKAINEFDLLEFTVNAMAWVNALPETFDNSRRATAQTTLSSLTADVAMIWERKGFEAAKVRFAEFAKLTGQETICQTADVIKEGFCIWVASIPPTSEDMRRALAGFEFMQHLQTLPLISK
jgi:hypothetical protein